MDPSVVRGQPPSVFSSLLMFQRQILGSRQRQRYQAGTNLGMVLAHEAGRLVDGLPSTSMDATMRTNRVVEGRGYEWWRSDQM